MRPLRPSIPKSGVDLKVQAWSSASQDDTYSAAGEALTMLRGLWGWPMEQRRDKVQTDFVACVAAEILRNGMPLTCAGIEFLQLSCERMWVAVSCTRVQRCNQVGSRARLREALHELVGCMIGSSVYSCLQIWMPDHYGIIWQVGGMATRSASSSANLRCLAQVSRCRSMG